MKRPFVVSMTVEAVVMAESIEDARGYVGRSAIREEVGNAVFSSVSAEPLVEPTGEAVLPAGWEGDALVYGRGRDESDLLTRDAIEAERQRLKVTT